MKKIALLILALQSLCSYAQNNIPTGTWRTHYSYNTIVSITQNESTIYAASKTGFFAISKNDQSLSSYTKLNGLSEIGITQIGYNSTTNSLIITYESGQIDLLKDNTFTSIPDIRLSDIIYSKATNHMYALGNYCYLSTNLGVILLDTEKQRIQDSYLNLSSSGSNLKIYASVVSNDSLFLATESGIMAGSLSDNLKDFSKWKRFDVGEGLNQEPYKVLSLYQNKPITGSDDTGVYTYTNGKWTSSGDLMNQKFHSIERIETDVLITTENGIYRLSNNGLDVIGSSYTTSVSKAIGDNSTIWIADARNGVIRTTGTSEEIIYPSGPFFNDISKLTSFNGKIFALPKYESNIGQPLRNTEGFSLFENGQWYNYNTSGYPQTEQIPEFLDISCVGTYKGNDVVFGSNGYGIMTWEDNTFTILDESNSPLVNSFPPDRNVFIKDINSDQQGVWVLNNNSISSSLYVLTPNQSWTSYTTSSVVANANQIELTPWGEPWIAIDPSNGGGIYVYNPKGNETLLTYSGSGTIPSNTINDLLLDKEDKMWIATTKGVVYFPYPYDIIGNTDQTAIVPVIDFNPLFYQENVNTLAVDGGNRIWMGTNNGAWLFANDGTELVEHFTTENSPLLSNVVEDIAINDLSGEVFFDTDAGLISYRGSGTLTGTYKTPKIYPNPVPPGFSGVITIEGVPLNSALKITDASGRLIAQMNANGNTAVWDVHNSNQMEIGTGVYFVFISLKDGTEHQFGKIAVVK